MRLLSKILNFFKALNGNVSKAQLAAGFACGVLLALIPAGNLLWIALYLVFMFFKINAAAEFLTIGILKLAYGAFAPLTDAAGWSILGSPALQGFFTRLYNTPIVPFTRFNNSLVMGGLAVGLGAWIPLFILFFILIGLYRRRISPRLKNSGFYKAIAKHPFVQKLADIGAKAASVAGGK